LPQIGLESVSDSTYSTFATYYLIVRACRRTYRCALCVLLVVGIGCLHCDSVPPPLAVHCIRSRISVAVECLPEGLL
jgi:hypothetical protein